LRDNIRVTSIVDRFLEHSRVYYFQQGSIDPVDGKFYIGSADWMRRNLSFRIEALAEIDDRVLRGRLREFMQILLNDRRQGWDILPDGSSVRREPAQGAGGRDARQADEDLREHAHEPDHDVPASAVIARMRESLRESRGKNSRTC
jgi:polyphosphate kinase